MMDTSTLSPAQLHALALLGKQASKVRKELAVQSHDLNFVIHVTGTLNVSGDQQVNFTSAPNAVTIAAMFLGTYGPRKRRQIADQLFTDYAAAVDDDLRELAEQLIQRLSTSKPGKKKGAVSGKLNASLLA